MITQRLFGIGSALVLCSSFSFGQTSSSAPPPAQKADAYQMQVPAKVDEKKPLVIPDQKLTDHGRMEIIRGMTAELGYARTAFPFGKTGLTLKDGKLIEPTDEQLQEMLTIYGPAIKKGEPAHITDIKFKDKEIIFDINGGPQKKKKWYQHIQVGVGGSGGGYQPGQPTDDTNIHGSYVALEFDKFVPEVTPAQIKQLLDPVINFSAKSATQAYLDTVPAPAKKAITEHKALVGMNREMVTYALGRPPQKYRDKDADGTEYEEWIYGAPPADVQFVRFEGDEVVRIETMKVDGTKTVRTQKEVVLPEAQPEVAEQGGQPPAPAQAQPQTQPQPGGGTADTPDASSPRPSLRRPGEEVGQPPDQGRPQRIPGPMPTGGTPPDQPGPANVPPQ